MACFTKTFDPARGPIAAVMVSSPHAKPLRYDALFDSGAQFCHISSAVARDLGLLHARIARVQGIGGPTLSNAYSVNIAIEGSNAEFSFRNCCAYSFEPASNTGYEVILGRDVLCRGHFSMSLDGRFLFCI